MGATQLNPQLMDLVADRFKALSEPARLQILNTLRVGEQTVSGLVDRTGLGQANVSKHLQILFEKGFVERRKQGLYVHYSLAGEDVFKLCDIVCGRLAAEASERGRVLTTG